MKHLITAIALIGAFNAFAAGCPDSTLILKSGARTHYSTDLKTKFRQADLEKFGCRINASVMSADQRRNVLKAEYEVKLNSI